MHTNNLHCWIVATIFNNFVILAAILILVESKHATNRENSGMFLPRKCAIFFIAICLAWVLTGDLIEIEDCHIAAVLKNGEVLAAAGEVATM